KMEDIDGSGGIMATKHGASSRRQDATVANKYAAFLLADPTVAYLRAQPGACLTIDNTPLTPDIYSKFALYLQSVAGAKVSRGTSMIYLSSIRRQSLTIHPSATLLVDAWATEARLLTHKAYHASSLATGTKLKNSAPPMSLADLSHICLTLWSENDAPGFVNSSRDRSLISMQWSAIGRSSDMGGLRYDQLLWNDDCLVVSLDRQKTAECQSISVVHAALQWTLDPLHALACQFASRPHDTSFHIFSQLGHENDGSNHYSAHINRVLKRLGGKD
ncbi:hypothetical protein SDRG_16819, partial [Saprolegnia diclina VS20]